MPSSLSRTPFNPEFRHGAHSAIHTCLRLRPEERVTLITDRRTAPIAASLAAEIESVGSAYNVFVLEEVAQRPMTTMPAEVIESLNQSSVSIFAARAQKGELPSRVQMCDVVGKRRIRHGHMVNISERIMLEGMRADFLEVDRLSAAVIGKAKGTKSLTATTPAGTDIRVSFSPGLRWLKTSGIISEDTWGNLPGGEIFTTPHRIDGVFVCDGVVGDYLCEKYGDLRSNPLYITIGNNRILDVRCDNAELLRDFRTYTTTDANSDRVGEFAIGTNIAVRDLIGEILQDEKYPGIHIAFGHPYAEQTGADWTSTTHIDCVGRNFTIRMDGEQIMTDGTFSDTVLGTSR